MVYKPCVGMISNHVGYDLSYPHVYVPVGVVERLHVHGLVTARLTDTHRHRTPHHQANMGHCRPLPCPLHLFCPLSGLQWDQLPVYLHASSSPLSPGKGVPLPDDRRSALPDDRRSPPPAPLTAHQKKTAQLSKQRSNGGEQKCAPSPPPFLLSTSPSPLPSALLSPDLRWVCWPWPCLPRAR